jgi:TetR/AcrR family transcriptional regulator, cholesterol catabolism regulator
MARERATDTRALVAAAAVAFGERGYHNSTIDDIAVAAGISRPTVYKYTKSKQHLLDLMVTEVTTDLGRRLDEILSDTASPRERLRHFISAHVQATLANRAFYAIVFSEEVELSVKSRDSFRKWAHERTQQCAGLLGECIGEIPGSTVDPGIAANLLESMLATLYRWYDPAGSVSPDELVDQIMQFADGISPTT